MEIAILITINPRDNKGGDQLYNYLMEISIIMENKYKLFKLLYIHNVSATFNREEMNIILYEYA